LIFNVIIWEILFHLKTGKKRLIELDNLIQGAKLTIIKNILNSLAKLDFVMNCQSFEAKSMTMKFWRLTLSGRELIKELEQCKHLKRLILS